MKAHLLTSSDFKEIIENAVPGRFNDGGSLVLVVAKTGTASWVWRYRSADRVRDLGLGAAGLGNGQVDLDEARRLAEDARAIVKNGGDPHAELGKRQPRAVSVEKRELGSTFGELAEHVISLQTADAKHAKTRAQWEVSLGAAEMDLDRVRDVKASKAHRTALARLRRMDVARIDSQHVVDVLMPIWLSTPEAAERCRRRIEKVLSTAIANKKCQPPNPARYRDNLQHLLPKRSRKEETHHAAVDYADLPTFFRDLHNVQRPGLSHHALAFLVLTACRTGEVLGAQWSEIDLGRVVWTIPGSRMKLKKEHRVPLSAQALAILETMRRFRRGRGGLVFPGTITGKPMSDMSMKMALRRMGYAATVHGFRSSFRDWVAEETEYPREVAEMALAHKIEDKVERAYRRGDLYTKRGKLMQLWADFVCSKLPKDD